MLLAKLAIIALCIKALLVLLLVLAHYLLVNKCQPKAGALLTLKKVKQPISSQHKSLS